MKKVIIVAASAVVVVGGVFGAYKINEHRKNGKAVAKVTPVSFMTDYYYGSELELNGMITSGNVQNITTDSQKLVEKVLVKEGDTVKKGDPVLKYDITALELDLKKKENAVAVAESDIKIANKELSKLKNLKSSESMPELPEPEETPTNKPTESEKPSIVIKETINNTSDSMSGNGTDKDPLIFNCVGNTVIKAEVFSSLKTNGNRAVFIVYDENYTKLYQWNISPDDITDENIADKTIGENVTLDVDGNVTVKWTEKMFGSYTVITADETTEDYNEEISQEDFYDSISRDYPEDYIYSRAELSKMISEKEMEIKRLETEKKSADLEYRIAKDQKESGSVLAQIDGVVSEINDDENLEAGESFIIINGEGGMTVTGYIGEMNLNRIEIGSSVNVMFWETGEVIQAEITEIGDIPISYESQNWGENPNSSTYEFKAIISDNVSVSTDAGISITLPSEEISNSIYIPKVYVREEDGKSYVYKANEQNRLEKVYIKTGKIIYGSEIEIKSGLSEDDKICFPYGKHISEGIKTEDSDEVLW